MTRHSTSMTRDRDASNVVQPRAVDTPGVIPRGILDPIKDILGGIPGFITDPIDDLGDWLLDRLGVDELGLFALGLGIGAILGGGFL